MTDAVSGRVRPVGLGVILAALLLLVVPLRMFNAGGHPLAGAENVELCAALERDALRALPGTAITVQREIPDLAERLPGTCYVRMAAAADTREATEVSVALMNRRSLAQGSIRFKTGQYLEVFLEEERASGNAVTTATGPWTAGATIARRAAEDRLDLLAEDGGVLLWFRAQGLTRPQLIEFAAASARAARASGSGASP